MRGGTSQSARSCDKGEWAGMREYSKRKLNFRLREAQHRWAQAHIVDAKHHIICGLPQPRSFVPRAAMMLTWRSNDFACSTQTKLCLSAQMKKSIAFAMDFLAPPVGLEPTTPWLTVMCSTDWAKEEYLKVAWIQTTLFCVGYDLSFRTVSSQVFSALQSLTSVFGMGTGGPFALK